MSSEFSQHRLKGNEKPGGNLNANLQSTRETHKRQQEQDRKFVWTKEEPKMGFEARLLIAGVFKEQDVQTTLSDTEVVVPEELVSNVEAIWEPKAKKGWTPGLLFHLNSFALDHNGKLSLSFAHTNYKDFIGASNWEFWRQKRLELDFDRIPSPLVTSTVIVTADNKMVIQMRGKNVHQGGRIDALGGHIDTKKDINQATDTVDPFQAARREVIEEAGLTDELISEILCLGLSLNHYDVAHYAASFVVKTDLTANEVLALTREEEEVAQVGLTVVTPARYNKYSTSNVIAVIRKHYPNVDPEARITILLAMAYLRGKPKEKQLYTNKSGIKELFDQIKK